MNRTLLDVLMSHPFVSPEQIGALLLWHPNAVRIELAELERQHLTACVNPRSPELGTRALYFPTRRAVEEYATETQRAECSGARMLHLWLLIERLYRVRNVFLTLPLAFHAREWLVERALLTPRGKRVLQWNAHGIARIQDARGESILLIEWDTGALAYDRARLARYADWFRSYNARPINQTLPVHLLVLARDLVSLLHYYASLRAAAQARRVEMPSAFFASQREWFQHGSDAPIWYGTATGRKSKLLEGVTASRFHSDASLSELLQLAPLRVTQTTIGFEELETSSSDTSTLDSLAACRRELSREAKRVLAEIGTHPLLSAVEISDVIQDALWRVRGALNELQRHALVEPIIRAGETRFVLSTRGMAYLAAVHGFRQTPRRYLNARGWRKGFEGLVHFHAHTQLANAFMLQVAKIARTRNARFEWRSELESHLYYKAQGRRWSFRPDALCFYQEGALRVQVALEIERHRASRESILRKLKAYQAYLESALYRLSQSEQFRVWMVVTSWQHAERVRACVLQLSRSRAAPMLPVWLTTFDLVRERGLAHPIWRRADTWQRCHCIESWNEE